MHARACGCRATFLLAPLHQLHDSTHRPRPCSISALGAHRICAQPFASPSRPLSQFEASLQPPVSLASRVRVPALSQSWLAIWSTMRQVGSSGIHVRIKLHLDAETVSNWGAYISVLF
ncbi:hypothetical protein EJ04DRAFT_356081 [Polyplosphaeria fusca]|uniref:Uncharacterized protein n=1 Tax=Polyplosphaeria fusca TaxID=682080 RepID=A0A9P4R9M4_9PLEO|nr:hypothetical protein EJ04DRAFT_356081 [Polyplosphaeria fusca]